MTTNNKQLLAAFALALCMAPWSAGASFAPEEWKWKKPITLPVGALTGDAYIKINLDYEASIFSMPGLLDLRVVSGGTKEVPFQLITESTKEGRVFSGAMIVDRATDNGDMVLIVDVGQNGQKHNAIDIVAATPNYRRQVSIYSSDVLLPWGDPKWGWINPTSRNGALVRSTDAFIYRFTDTELGFSAENGTVYYPETASRYLRVVIHKENEKKELLSISGMSVYQDMLPTVREEEMSTMAQVVENKTEQSTEIIVDLGGGGLPTKAITLTTLDKSNFNRRATVASSNDGQNWRLISQGYLFFVRTPLFNGTELTLRYPEASSRYLRVVIFNDDNQPVQFEGTVLLRSTLRSIVFAAREGEVYALYYGNSRAKLPKYDLSRYFQYIESIAVPRASLGAQVANTAFSPASAPQSSLTETYPQLVNAVLVLLVAVVTFIMISYLKKLKLSKPAE